MEGADQQGIDQGIAVLVMVVVAFGGLFAGIAYWHNKKYGSSSKPAEPPVSAEAKELRTLVNMIGWGCVGFLVVYFWQLIFQ